MIKNLNLSKISNLLFAFWLFTIVVILWGAWVRISHSGNGCGDHWPLCGGEFIPTSANAKTWVEYTHRMMSGLYGLIVIYCFFIFRKPQYSETTKKLSKQANGTLNMMMMVLTPIPTAVM